MKVLELYIDRCIFIYLLLSIAPWRCWNRNMTEISLHQVSFQSHHEGVGTSFGTEQELNKVRLSIAPWRCWNLLKWVVKAWISWTFNRTMKVLELFIIRYLFDIYCSFNRTMKVLEPIFYSSQRIEDLYFQSHHEGVGTSLQCFHRLKIYVPFNRTMKVLEL